MEGEMQNSSWFPFGKSRWEPCLSVGGKQLMKTFEDVDCEAVGVFFREETITAGLGWNPWCSSRQVFLQGVHGGPSGEIRKLSFVFFRLDRTCAVNQETAGIYQAEGLPEQGASRRTRSKSGRSKGGFVASETRS